jgi:hypothetical protein
MSYGKIKYVLQRVKIVFLLPPYITEDPSIFLLILVCFRVDYLFCITLFTEDLSV